MQRTSFREMLCPIARGLDRVGEWWSILILRDALDGSTRFDQFQRSLPIAPNMLARRLAGLVRTGLMERRKYQDRPARFEYVLTRSGRDFQPVIVALYDWGADHFPSGKETTRLVHRKTGARAHPVLVDRKSGRPINTRDFHYVPGPDATDKVKERMSYRTASASGRRPA
jgi:DNA-binding HxlR family transcriptional regulator